MSAVTQASSVDRTSRSDANSAIDRVRLRMTRLIHLSRDRAAADPPGNGNEGVGARVQTTVAVSPADESQMCALAVEVCTLQQVIENTEKLLREGWNVAAELNRVRRGCNPEAAGVLSEALGLYQGLLNQCRHNLRAASKAVDNIRVGLSHANG